MKKILLVAIMVMTTSIILTGCINNRESNGDNGGSHGGHTNTPVLKNYSEFFNPTVTAMYNDQVTQVLDHTGQYESFNDLLDRQIEVLAQDILFRLFITYGKQDTRSWLTPIYTNYGQGSYIITENVISNGSYNSNGDYALIDIHSVISQPDSYDGDRPNYKLSNGEDVWGYTHYAQYYLNEPASYASIFYLGYWRSSLLDSLFTFEDSISGYYHVGTLNDRSKYLAQDNSMSWQWDYNGANIDLKDSASEAFNKYLDTYKEPFKSAIANLLATNNPVGLDYSTALDKIGHLGFRDTDKANILDYVTNEVIGEYQYSLDKDYKPNFDILSPSNEQIITDQNRRYKAYGVIVPSVVETAFNNTFYNTNTSLYVERASRFDEIQNGIMYTNLSDRNYTSIQLKPSKIIELTMVEITVNGVDRSQLKTVEYSVYSSTTSSIATNLVATIGNSSYDSSTHKITIDLSKLGTKTIDSNGYIMIYFDIDSSITFSVTIDGYYS